MIRIVTGLAVLLSTGLCYGGEDAKVPMEVLEDMQFYVGNWSIEGTVGDAPFKGRASFRMPRGNYCTIGTMSYRVEKRRQSLSLVCGWDSSTGEQTELGIGNDGETYKILWKTVSPTVAEGKVTGTLEGKKTASKARVEKTGKDTFVFAGTNGTKGDEKVPDFRYTARRVTKKGKKQASPSDQ